MMSLSNTLASGTSRPGQGQKPAMPLPCPAPLHAHCTPAFLSLPLAEDGTPLRIES